MSDFLTSVVAVVGVLGFMILIHEFGHYAVAKLLGVRRVVCYWLRQATGWVPQR
jgi:hypothetical protein